jgi:hypothetical protein
MQEEQPDQVRNPRGWLLKAIEHDYGPPAGYRPREERLQKVTEKQRRIDVANHRKDELQRVQAEAARKRQQQEQAALARLQKQYGTPPADVALWQDILAELKEEAGAATYALAKAVHLLTIEDETAVFATSNSFVVDRVRESIGGLLVEMFRQRGHEVQEMKAVILGDRET